MALSPGCTANARGCSNDAAGVSFTRADPRAAGGWLARVVAGPARGGGPARLGGAARPGVGLHVGGGGGASRFFLPPEAAPMPNLALRGAGGGVGRAAVIPDGFPPGSDVGNMAILGYDPAEFHTGRAPIEAAAMGIDLGADEVAYRCNLVTIDDATS